MNREQLINMAKEAGLEPGYYEGPSEENFVMFPGIERFANIVAAVERRACAKYVRNLHTTSDDVKVALPLIAHAIETRAKE